ADEGRRGVRPPAGLSQLGLRRGRRRPAALRAPRRPRRPAAVCPRRRRAVARGRPRHLDAGQALMDRGSILKRRNKDGTVTYSIKYRAADGTQIKRKAGATRKEAQQALTAALAAVDRGEQRAPSKETFAEAAERWLRRKRPLLEASTYQDYD